MVSRCLSVTRLPFLSFALRASKPRLLAVAVPCILQRNCQRSVVSFQTLPETTANPLYNPYPFSRFKQWSRPSKRSPVEGGRSQAAGRAFTAFNQADLACSGNAWYVGEASISIANYNATRFYTGMATARWLWASRFDTATRLHLCALHYS